MKCHRIPWLHVAMNVRHEPAEQVLYEEEGDDQPMKYFIDCSILGLFIHDAIHCAVVGLHFEPRRLGADPGHMGPPDISSY